MIPLIKPYLHHYDLYQSNGKTAKKDLDEEKKPNKPNPERITTAQTGKRKETFLRKETWEKKSI